MNQILWTPTQSQVDASQMEAFRKQVNARFNLNLNDYHDLHQWSVSNITDFWKAIWGFMAIKFSSDYKQVVDDDTKMPGAKWFDGVTFNFAENLLRVRSDKPAIHFKGEGQPAHTLSYNELFHAVETLASALRKMGLKKGIAWRASCPICLRPLSLCWRLPPLVPFGLHHRLTLVLREF